MRKADIFVSLFFLFIGIMVLMDAVRLGFKWGMSGPEAGFFPFYLALGMILCALLVLLNVAVKFRKERVDQRLMPKGALKPILWVLIPATAMVAITELVGLHLAAALYLGFYMRAVGKTGWVTTLCVGLLVPLSLYIAFDKLFLVPLPQGLWGARLLPF